jgi:hypothetical protein
MTKLAKNLLVAIPSSNYFVEAKKQDLEGILKGEIRF